MRRYIWAFASLMLIVGCESGMPYNVPPSNNGGDGPDAVGTSSATLAKFHSEDEFVTYFMGQVGERGAYVSEPQRDDADNDNSFDGDMVEDVAQGFPAAPGEGLSEESGGGAGQELVSVPPTSGSDNENFSPTTTQESGVDEADVVKTDGEYLYIIENQRLHIVHAAPLDAMAEVATVELTGYGRDLYLRGDRLVVITEEYGGYMPMFGPEPMPVDIDVDMPMSGGGSSGSQGGMEIMPLPAEDMPPMIDLPTDDPAGIDGDSGGSDDVEIIDEDADILPDDAPYHFERPKVVVTIIDVSDRAAPRVVSATKYEGSTASSRMIDGVLHLVLANYPHYYFDVMPMMGTRDVGGDVMQATTLLPKYERTDAAGEVSDGEVITWENLYRPDEPDGFGMVTVVSIDVDADGAFSAVGVVAEPALIYSSIDALYLTDANYYWDGDRTMPRETTDIYKFAYVGRGAEAAAAGTVPGRILNQYSMSEYDGHLRVATTLGNNFFLDGDRREETVNAVYVLRQVDAELTVTGAIEDVAPGETIQSARFVGDRGYLVTFEQVDPLFTLDLSNHEQPTIVGELKVPGFSTFLVPMGADHLLAVGQYIPEDRWSDPWGVQLSVFDVSNFASPRQAQNLVIAGENEGSYSEALYDPKAFTYFAQRNLVALPVSIYPYYTSGEFLPEPDIDFEVIEDLIDVDALLDLLGDIDFENLSEEELQRLAEEFLNSEEFVDLWEGDGDDIQDIFAPPDPESWPGFDGLIVYEVSVDGGFREVARISTRMGEGYFYFGSFFTRGVFIDGNVYAVTNLGVRGLSLDAPDQTAHEVLFEIPDMYPMPVGPYMMDDVGIEGFDD
jgi:hypothetical protein